MGGYYEPTIWRYAPPAIDPTGPSKKLRHFRRLVHHNATPAYSRTVERQRVNGHARLLSMRFTRKRKAAMERLRVA